MKAYILSYWVNKEGYWEQVRQIIYSTDENLYLPKNVFLDDVTIQEATKDDLDGWTLK